MDPTSFLQNSLIILSAAVLVVSVVRYFKISPILGYLLAGLAIGPNALGFIRDLTQIEILGHLGIVFLLFTIALKMPLQRLQVLRRYVFVLGSLQVAVTGGAIALLIGLIWDLPIDSTFLIGGTVALSSTAVVLRLLAERGDIGSKSGRITFAVLLFQDLAVVLLLVLLSLLQESEESFVQVLGLAALKAFVVLSCIILVGRLLVRPLYRGIAHLNNPELFIAVSLLMVLLISVATASAGLSMELGAFLAGLLLSETEYRHQVEADIQPFYGLLLGLFFMHVGMIINPHYIAGHMALIFGVVAGMLVVKTFIFMVIARIMGISLPTAIRAGLLLSVGGEFVFIVALPALKADLLTPDVIQLLFSVVAFSMALAPFLEVLGKKLEDKFLNEVSDHHMEATQEEISDLRNHVIIAGFGRVGELLSRIFAEQLIPYVVIENDMQRVSDARSRGLPVYFGDARRAEVMRTLGAEKARAAIVCVDNSRSLFRIAMMLRRQFPNLAVSVRLRDDEFEAKLLEMGAAVILPETLEPSLQLAASTLRAMGIPDTEAEQVIETYRRTYQPIARKVARPAEV